MNYLTCFILLFCFFSLSAQTTAEIDWLNGHLSPIKTVKAGNSMEDLHSVKQLVKDAKIVALDESTHGSKEIFQMKHRLLEYLVEEMGFSIFTIEADLAAAHVINEYVLNNQGDSTRVLGTLSPIWRTQEVWEMIKWMRTYNRQEENKIKFMGFDMQNPWAALHNLEKFAKESAHTQLESLLSELTTLHRDLERSAKNHGATKQQIARLSEQVERILSTTKASPFLRHNAHTLMQLSKMNKKNGQHASQNARDKAMAENVEMMLDYNREAKIVLWAHNAHVQKYGRGCCTTNKYTK